MSYDTIKKEYVAARCNCFVKKYTPEEIEKMKKEEEKFNRLCESVEKILNENPNTKVDEIIIKTKASKENRGGTGATTESNARSNLSVYSKSETDTLLSSKAPYEVKSSTDFNSMTTPGLYTMRSSSTNSPSGGSYHSLIVLKSDTGNYVQQLAVKESTTQKQITQLSQAFFS